MILVLCAPVWGQCIWDEADGSLPQPVVNPPNSNVLLSLQLGQNRGLEPQPGIVESCDVGFTIHRGTHWLNVTITGDWYETFKFYGSDSADVYIWFEQPSYMVMNGVELDANAFPLPNWTANLSSMTQSGMTIQYLKQFSLNVSSFTAAGDFFATMHAGIITEDLPLAEFFLNVVATDDPSFITAVDPVPDLVNAAGTGVVTDTETLSEYGTPIEGVAADSASLVVLRIPAQSAGEQFTVQLINDQGVPSSSPQADGQLMSIGGSIPGSQIQVTSVNTNYAGPLHG
ncbi:MAG TPA: hypothetical protein VMF91_18815 [Bryobacteraceae bacterium]|nr:hypothetical protein [Bryobacteraceae bacterium]